jgi:hypothetical protein
MRLWLKGFELADHLVAGSKPTVTEKIPEKAFSKRTHFFRDALRFEATKVCLDIMIAGLRRRKKHDTLSSLN